MIGWKCDVGYFNTTAPNNISQFNITDRDAYITIPTVSTDAPLIDYANNDVNNVYNYVYDYFGQNMDTLYGLPIWRGRDDSFIAIFHDLFPSLWTGYPNLYSMFDAGEFSGYPISKWPAVHIKSLNLVLILDQTSTSGEYLVFKYSSGLLQKMYDRISLHDFVPFPLYRGAKRSGLYTNCEVAFIYLTGYDENKEISECALYWGEYRLYEPSWGTSPLWDNNEISVQNKTRFAELFPSGTKPDITVIIPDNPYEPGGPSGPTDPDLPPGTFDDESDPIPDSSLPTISAANTGFTRIYNPTLSQVQALAQYLWTTPDLIETIWNHIKQFFENPMDAIIGFNLVPVPVPDGGTENFKLMFIDTGVAMTAAANQFVDRDCGTVEIKRYYGSALDQSPYTKVSCFLPYIGTVQLNTDEVMGTTLQVKYRVDICSGSCVAKIFIDGNCLYQYSGHCAINIPISSADFSSYVSAAINVAKLAIGAATGGAAGAAMAATQVANSEQQTNNVVNWQSQYGVGSSSNLPAPIGISQSPGGPGPETEQTSTSASFAGLTPANISNTVGEIMNAKPHVEHSGSFSGNTGYLGVRRPFIIIERPNMCMPANYQALNGFPAMITMELGTCKGFTRVQQVQLTGMTATNPEQAEILELLKSGVVL